MDKLEKVFDNFVESVGKQFNLPKEAVTLIQGGFAKYTAMCESANPFSRGNQIQNMQARLTNRLVDALQSRIKPGATSGSFKSRENGIPFKYEYGPDSLVISNENDGSVIYSGGGAGWLNDANSIHKELKKAAHALLWGIASISRQR